MNKKITTQQHLDESMTSSEVLMIRAMVVIDEQFIRK